MLFSHLNSCSPLQPTLRRAGEQELGAHRDWTWKSAEVLSTSLLFSPTSWMNKIFVRPLWKHNYRLRGIEKRGSRGEAKLITNCRCFSADTFVIRGNVLSIDVGGGKITRRKIRRCKIIVQFYPDCENIFCRRTASVHVPTKLFHNRFVNVEFNLEILSFRFYRVNANWNIKHYLDKIITLSRW